MINRTKFFVTIEGENGHRYTDAIYADNADHAIVKAGRRVLPSGVGARTASAAVITSGRTLPARRAA